MTTHKAHHVGFSNVLTLTPVTSRRLEAFKTTCLYLLCVLASVIPRTVVSNASRLTSIKAGLSGSPPTVLVKQLIYSSTAVMDVDTPTYMFSDLLKGTHLNAEQMAALGYGPPELRVAYKTQKQPKDYYPYVLAVLSSKRSAADMVTRGPPHVYCDGCKDKEDACWMTALKVAELGGFFKTTSCYRCTTKGMICVGETRNKFAYLAFVDENTAVMAAKGSGYVYVTVCWCEAAGR